MNFLWFFSPIECILALLLQDLDVHSQWPGGRSAEQVLWFGSGPGMAVLLLLLQTPLPLLLHVSLQQHVKIADEACLVNTKVKLNTFTYSHTGLQISCIWFCFGCLFVPLCCQTSSNYIFRCMGVCNIGYSSFTKYTQQISISLLRIEVWIHCTSKHVTVLFHPLATGKHPTFRITTERRVSWLSPVTAISSGVPRPPSAVWKGWFIM